MLQIVILQIEAMELKTRISGKFKTQAQMDGECSVLMHTRSLSGVQGYEVAVLRLSSHIECLIVIKSKLEFKNGLLSDLKEEREERKEKIQQIGMVCVCVFFFWVAPQ